MLQVITRAEAGGAQSHLMSLLASVLNFADVHLAVGEDGPLTEFARRHGVEVSVIRSLVKAINPPKDLLAVASLAILVRRLAPDLVHCHSSKAGLVGRVAAAFGGAPAVFTAHGFGFTENAPWLRRMLTLATERILSPFTAKVIAVSNYDRALAIHLGAVSEEAIVTIHNGIPDTRWRADPGRECTPVLCIVARLAPPKDHANFLSAIAPLAHTNEFRVLFVGDGPDRQHLERLSADLGLNAHAEFLGTRSDVAEILANAHLLVLPSKYEGLPICVLEAMRAGLPVVATGVGGVPEAVVNGETGFLVAKGDEAGMRHAVERLIKDRELRARFGVAGRRRYESMFGAPAMVASTLAVYSEVLSSRGLHTGGHAEPS